MRGSWGSWSGTGTVVGGGSNYYHVDGSAGIGRAVGIESVGERTGDGDEDGGELVSPRVSESSGVTATGETVVSAVSRMSSMRNDDMGGKI